MDYDEINERMWEEMEIERDEERQVAGLVKLLWSGIIVAGVLIAIGIVFMLTACHKDTDTTGMATVKVTFNDFSITTEDFPTKDAVAAYTGVKAMTLAFFDAQGNAVYNTTQLRADNTSYTTFGEFSTELPMGSYTMVALGYGSEVPITLNGATEAVYTADRVRETFVVSQTVNVTSTNAMTINAAMDRVVSTVIVRSTDNRPSDVDSIRVTFSAGGKGVNPQTGFATTNSGFANTVAPTTAVGAPVSTINYLFLNTDQQSMNITVDALKADGTAVYHKVANAVPLQRNKVTVLRGQMFTAGANGGFTVNTSWIGDTNFVDL